MDHKIGASNVTSKRLLCSNRLPEEESAYHRGLIIKGVHYCTSNALPPSRGVVVGYSFEISLFLRSTPKDFLIPIIQKLIADNVDLSSFQTLNAKDLQIPLALEVRNLLPEILVKFILSEPLSPGRPPQAPN
ncbi:hypothetical protein TNCV_647381 [Trichonephila clavipes]|uniref:Uncharacterized protein n=1 Tax=Trichonephila clavipes TaxID=2585209 RepID=A0A8X6VNQ7_TRICX|nr:hypothetical protein TNCV_647381 [Trichonephila clavipes]